MVTSEQWTDLQPRLEALADAGHPAGDIAARLSEDSGETINRIMVLGRAHRTGVTITGRLVRRRMADLTDADVAEVRRLIGAEQRRVAEVADMTGWAESTLRRIAAEHGIAIHKPQREAKPVRQPKPARLPAAKGGMGSLRWSPAASPLPRARCRSSIASSASAPGRCGAAQTRPATSAARRRAAPTATAQRTGCWPSKAPRKGRLRDVG